MCLEGKGFWWRNEVSLICRIVHLRGSETTCYITCSKLI